MKHNRSTQVNRNEGQQRRQTTFATRRNAAAPSRRSESANTAFYRRLLQRGKWETVSEKTVVTTSDGTTVELEPGDKVLEHKGTLYVKEVLEKALAESTSATPRRRAANSSGGGTGWQEVSEDTRLEEHGVELEAGDRIRLTRGGVLEVQPKEKVAEANLLPSDRELRSRGFDDSQIRYLKRAAELVASGEAEDVEDIVMELGTHDAVDTAVLRDTFFSD